MRMGSEAPLPGQKGGHEIAGVTARALVTSAASSARAFAVPYARSSRSLVLSETPAGGSTVRAATGQPVALVATAGGQMASNRGVVIDSSEPSTLMLVTRHGTPPNVTFEPSRNHADHAAPRQPPASSL